MVLYGLNATFFSFSSLESVHDYSWSTRINSSSRTTDELSGEQLEWQLDWGLINADTLTEISVHSVFLRYASLLIHPGEGDIDDDITEDKSGDIEFDTDDASNNFSSEFRRFSWFEIFDFLITNLELLVWICPRKSLRLSDIDSVVIFNDLLSDFFSLKIFNFNLYIKSELFYEGKWVLNDSVQNILSGDTNVHLAQCQSVNQSIINYLRLILITSNSKLSLYIPVNLSWIYYFMKVLVYSTDGGPTELSHVLNGHHWDRSDEFSLVFISESF